MVGNYEKNYVNLSVELKEGQSSAWCMDFENAKETALVMEKQCVKVMLAPFETKLLRFDKKESQIEEGIAKKEMPILVVDTKEPMEVSIKG